MNFLQYSLQLGQNDTVIVQLDKQANVKLMDTLQFENYRHGRQHRYYGGLAKASPVHLKSPSAGHWYLVIDLGGYAGTVKASVSVRRA